MKTPFLFAPLITPARLRADWREALAIRPQWAASMFEVDADGEDLDHTSAGLVAVVGRTRPQPLNLSPLTAAILFELTRHNERGIHTNTNGSKPLPKVYAKLIFSTQAPQDATPLLRLIGNAKDGERAKPVNSPRDLSPENVQIEPHPHPRKDAREVNIKHAREAAEASAREWAGRVSIDVDAYVANLRALFAALDATAAG